MTMIRYSFRKADGSALSLSWSLPVARARLSGLMADAARNHEAAREDEAKRDAPEVRQDRQAEIHALRQAIAVATTPRPNLTKGQVGALKVLQARLDPRHPGFRGSPEVAKALASIAPYLDSWVLPLLDYALHKGDGADWMKDSINRDLCQVRRDELARERGAAPSGMEVPEAEVQAVAASMMQPGRN